MMDMLQRSKITRIHPHSPAVNLRHRRGTAEIELLLVILFVFIPILLLTGAGFRLGAKRLSNVFSAENQAYTQVTRGQNITTSGALMPIEGIAAIKPGLPTRMDVAAPQFNVNYAASLGIPGVSHTDTAAFLDFTWRYSQSPVPDDAALTTKWFADYVAESHPSDLSTSLGLKSSLPP